MDFLFAINAQPQFEDENAENQAPESLQTSNQVAEGENEIFFKIYEDSQNFCFLFFLAHDDDFDLSGPSSTFSHNPVNNSALVESTNSDGNPEDLLLSQERKVLKLAEMAENGLPTDTLLNDELAASVNNQPEVFDEETMSINEDISGIAEISNKDKSKAQISSKKGKTSKKARGKSNDVQERHVTFSPDILKTNENSMLPKTPVKRRSKRLSERSSHEKNKVKNI